MKGVGKWVGQMNRLLGSGEQPVFRGDFHERRIAFRDMVIVKGCCKPISVIPTRAKKPAIARDEGRFVKE